MDSFGLLGYRLGFRLNNWQSIFKLPLVFLGIIIKPDECFYPLFPSFKNPFVEQTLPAIVPSFNSSFTQYVRSLFAFDADILIVSGFGLSHQHLASLSGVSNSQYIASSKYMEVIVNGNEVKLNHYLTAEEILLCFPINRLITYESSAIAWTKKINSEIEITCYKAPGLLNFSPFYSFFIKKSLSRINIAVLDPQ